MKSSAIAAIVIFLSLPAYAAPHPGRPAAKQPALGTACLKAHGMADQAAFVRGAAGPVQCAQPLSTGIVLTPTKRWDKT